MKLKFCFFLLLEVYRRQWLRLTHCWWFVFFVVETKDFNLETKRKEKSRLVFYYKYKEKHK